MASTEHPIDDHDKKERPDFAKLRRQKKRQRKKQKRLERVEEFSEEPPVSKKRKRKHKLRPEAAGEAHSKRPKDAEDENKVTYAFDVDAMDHCETPLLAFAHLTAFLDAAARQLDKDRATLRIYDPYYCEGGVKRRLQSLGFPNVHNENEDFYKVVEEGRCPDFDVLVTNPPYSEEHIVKLLRFAAELPPRTFFALLLPNFVYTKEYFRSIFVGASLPFYLCPKKRYQYHTVKGRHQQKSAKKTAPFPSLWYLGIAKARSEQEKYKLIQKVEKGLNGRLEADIRVVVGENEISSEGVESALAVRLARSIRNLPEDALDHNDPRAKKIRNARKRKKKKTKN